MAEDSVEQLKRDLDKLDSSVPFGFFAHFGDGDMTARISMGDLENGGPLMDMAAVYLLGLQQTFSKEPGQSPSIEELAQAIQERAENIEDEGRYGMMFGSE